MTLKAKTKNTMKRNREASSSDTLPELHSIFRGEVTSLQPYGIFVKMPGCEKHGLVHISQISNSRVERPEEVVDLKEKIYCKVISIEPDGQKVSLSMKVVNQTTGQDLDPNQVQTSRDEQHRKKDFKEFPKIELGAVFDTVCKKCGGKGHLAQDCFHVPGGKSYELIEEVFEWPAKTQNEESPVSKRHKKDKKESKKHKKKSHKKEKSSSRSESKKEKRKHRSSHSESDHERKKRRISSSTSEDESLSTEKSRWLSTSGRSRQAREELPTNAKHSRRTPSPEETDRRRQSSEHRGSRKH